LCRALVECCMRFGPDAADASLLLSALDHELVELGTRPEFQAYRVRVEGDSINRLLLLPIVELFERIGVNAPS
ncbi:MAG: hypothetical protein ACHREM_19390, partial [Polyangiales bacterium]